MVKRTQQSNTNTEYFITFTCLNWLHLFQKSNAYDAFYKWFNYLNENTFNLLGYVIMPNHFHGIIHIPADSKKDINQLVANGKRFIAYEIIKGLKEKKENSLLALLSKGLTNQEIKKGQKHKVFKSSFDCKEIMHIQMLQIKLDYIHKNQCQGKWNLVNAYTDYPYSSAAFYELDTENKWLTSYAEIY